MKGWITAVLAVTFLSGTSTGYLIGKSATPEATLSYADRYVEQARQAGVTKQEDLDQMRAIYEEWEARVRAQKDHVKTLLSDQLDALDKDLSQRAQRILDKYKQR